LKDAWHGRGKSYPRKCRDQLAEERRRHAQRRRMETMTRKAELTKNKQLRKSRLSAGTGAKRKNAPPFGGKRIGGEATHQLGKKSLAAESGGLVFSEYRKDIRRTARRNQGNRNTLEDANNSEAAT